MLEEKKEVKQGEYEAWFDASYSEKTGKAVAACCVMAKDGRTIEDRKKEVRVKNSNEGEFIAFNLLVTRLLSIRKAEGIKKLTVYGDSLNIIKEVGGDNKKEKKLSFVDEQFFDDAMQRYEALNRKLELELKWISSNQNAADPLTRSAPVTTLNSLRKKIKELECKDNFKIVMHVEEVGQVTILLRSLYNIKASKVIFDQKNNFIHLKNVYINRGEDGEKLEEIKEIAIFPDKVIGIEVKL